MKYIKLTRRQLANIVLENQSYYDEIQKKYNNLSLLKSYIYIPNKLYNGENITNVQVWNIDTLECAEILIKRELLNPLILNMASHKRPGGGYKDGSSAQEESLFHRTTYALSLDCSNTIPEYRSQVLRKAYAYYSPNVLVIRDSQYYLMDYENCFITSFVAIAGIPLQTGEILTSIQRELMIQKIRLICQVAISEKHDSLVLGALGCGVFHNNPYQIANMFKQIIQTEYHNIFKMIVFAVLPPNYEVFNKVLSQKVN
jgi:uncharacterized protein (TIGR02452 family)